VWESEFSYDLIRVHLPKEFKVHEFFNVEEYLIEGSSILIKKLMTQNYFGLVVYSTEIYKEILTRKKILVEFLFQGNVKYTHTFTARIIRPMLQIFEAPKIIVVKEGIDPRKLINFSVKYSGLGRARIRIEATHMGEIISHTESLYYQILKRMIDQKLFLGATPEEAVALRKEGIRIDPEPLIQLAEDMVEKMRRGIIPPDIDQEALEEFNEWLKNSENVDKLVKMIFSEVEQLMIRAILYYLDKHPSEDVELVQGITKTIFKSRVKEITVIIHYKDSLDNEYEPVQVTMKVDDQRKNVEKIFEAPINIKWISERIDLGM
jgi:hypothetical protein